jgi:hypothetical protein
MFFKLKKNKKKQILLVFTKNSLLLHYYKQQIIMNTLINILNENGYKNTNSNRERAVRNMNLLIDSGIMSIKLIPSEAYNAKQNGRGFWMMCKDGKKRPTAYKINLYGKTYFGHIMQKSLTTKYKHIQHMDGTWEYATHTDYYDNTNIDISEIQIRVARLLIIIREDKDFFAPKLFAAKGDCSCSKCSGVGIIPAFIFYANGICFDCGGSGINRDYLKSFIKKTIDNTDTSSSTKNA